jgi:periplasmic protein TonB
MDFEAGVRRAVSENRFLQSVFTVTVSSLLVCGSLLLLTSTAPWTRLPPESEPSTPDAAGLAEAAPSASDQADTSSETDADGTHTASTWADLLPEPLAETTDPSALSPAEAELAALGTPLAPDSVDRVEDLGPEGAAAKDEAPEIALETPAEIAAVLVAWEVPNASETTAAATDQIGGLLATLSPRAIASDKTEPATVEVADVLADLPAPPPTVASANTEPATEIAAEVLAAAAHAPPPADSESGKNEAAQLVAAGPPLPLPRRKPEAPPEPKVAAPAPEAEAQPQPRVAAASAPPREKAATREATQQDPTPRSGGLLGIWKPMALAPADEPPVSASKPATARPSGAAYASQVWARLARYKPRAGQRGSASVSFAIGANGMLGAARIARSSGNARIDQLALQTVRSAAPFPRPPAGSASYTIRIDFQ